MGSTSSLPFKISDDDLGFNTNLFNVKRGFSTDGKEVSVFVHIKKQYTNSETELALNSLENLKTLRHPNIVEYKESLIDDKKIIIVTERVQSFESVKNDFFENGKNGKNGKNEKKIKIFDENDEKFDEKVEKIDEKENFENLMSFGIFQIFNAVKFLNEKCNKIHGNITANSIFISKCGEWKLFGFEYSHLKNAINSDLNHHFLNHIQSDFPQPSFVNLTRLFETTPEKSEIIDLWCLSNLINTIFIEKNFGSNNEYKFSTIKSISELLSQRNLQKIPPRLVENYIQFSAELKRLNYSTEWNFDLASQIEIFLSSGFFKNHLISTACFVAEIHLKSLKEKEKFFKRLKDNFSSIPKSFCRYKILPVLTVIVFQGFESNLNLLNAILNISQQLSQEDFANIVTPTIVRLYQLSLRSVRFNLLDQFKKYINKMSEEVVNSVILDCFSKGFYDSDKRIREASVENAYLLSKRLSENNINSKLLYHISKLQYDKHPSLRYNAVISLAKIGQTMNSSKRPEFIFKACKIALDDTFLPSKIGGLLTLFNSSRFFDVNLVATRLIPLISPFVVDESEEIQNLSLKCLEKYVQFIKNPPEDSVQKEEEELPSTYTQKLTRFISGIVTKANTISKKPQSNSQSKNQNSSLNNQKLNKNESNNQLKNQKLNEIDKNIEIVKNNATNDKKIKNKGEIKRNAVKNKNRVKVIKRASFGSKNFDKYFQANNQSSEFTENESNINQLKNSTKIEIKSEENDGFEDFSDFEFKNDQSSSLNDNFNSDFYDKNSSNLEKIEPEMSLLDISIGQITKNKVNQNFEKENNKSQILNRSRKKEQIDDFINFNSF